MLQLLTILATKKSSDGSFFMVFLVFVGGIIFVAYNYFSRLLSEKVDKKAKELLEKKYSDEIKKTEKVCCDIIEDTKKHLSNERKKIEEEKQKLKSLKEALFKILEERQMGFPWLADKISKATTIIYSNSYQKRRIYDYRNALREIEELKGLIEYHEFLYPHLKELHTKIEEIRPEENSLYTKEEKEDETHFWLTPEEYRNLPTIERNQLALDRYKKRYLSKWEIGKMYERYIGFLYEKEGYKVDYDGIKYRFEDRGRDLICSKEETVVIIQCKMWSVSKIIYENSIFQFFGTVFYARMEERRKNPFAPKTVKGLFYTSTKLSEYAIEAAKLLDIKIINKPLDKNYPCIKCNIGKNGEKIYHLPFDQQYDNTKIEPHKNEFYATTCQEAEKAGFRRAKRFLNNNI